MKIVTVREISRHFTRHAELSMEGEVVRVFSQGKPYVRIVPDEQSPGKKVPHVDFAARAKKDFGGRRAKTDMVRQIIGNRPMLPRFEKHIQSDWYATLSMTAAWKVQ